MVVLKKKNNPKVYLHVVVIDTCTVAGEANKNKSAINSFVKITFSKMMGSYIKNGMNYAN